MDYLEAIKLTALRDVVRETPEYRLRHIFRWYSRTFCTPLHMVDDLPVEDVLSTYFEVLYENMDEVERLEEARKMSMDKTELEAIQKRLEEEEAALVKFALERERQQRAGTQKGLTKQSPAPKLSPVPEAPSRLEDSIAAEPLIKMDFPDFDEP